MKSSDNSSEIEQILQELHKAFFMLHKLSDRCLQKNSDITLSQFMILRTIEENSPLSASEVALKLNITKAAVSRHLDNLLEAELIEKFFNNNNHREYVLTISKNGSFELEKSRKVLENDLDDIMIQEFKGGNDLIKTLKRLNELF